MFLLTKKFYHTIIFYSIDFVKIIVFLFAAYCII